MALPADGLGPSTHWQSSGAHMWHTLSPCCPSEMLCGTIQTQSPVPGLSLLETWGYSHMPSSRLPHRAPGMPVQALALGFGSELVAANTGPLVWGGRSTLHTNSLTH